MKSKWQIEKIGKLVDIRRGSSPRPIHKFLTNAGMPWVKIADATSDSSRYLLKTNEYIIDEGIEKSVVVEPETLIVSNSATPGLPKIMKTKACVHDGWLVFSNYRGITRDFLYYKFIDIRQKLVNQANGSVFQNLKTNIVKDFAISIPSIQTQNKIVDILSKLDEKIELNNAINNNLEQQLNAIFVNMFADKIDNLEDDTTTLADLVGIVDNRGKTPPLSVEVTDYPIIDVKALSGNSRIIDYNNCTKYVSEDTYNTWFRSGHPQPEDILISTVGSLAEMKIFLGDIGCIAQNVVGFRSKEISPYYLYQYLNYIKHDLVAYNIGSVQPSIKITHIIKHAIYVPDEQQIKAFDTLARSISNQIFANCNENKNLTQLRDTLLPKLMSSELDVSNIDL